MKTRTTIAALAALFVTSAAQAADHMESPALAIGTLTTSTSTSQSNGTGQGTVQTEMVQLELKGR